MIILFLLLVIAAMALGVLGMPLLCLGGRTVHAGPGASR